MAHFHSAKVPGNLIYRNKTEAEEMNDYSNQEYRHTCALNLFHLGGATGGNAGV